MEDNTCIFYFRFSSPFSGPAAIISLLFPSIKISSDPIYITSRLTYVIAADAYLVM